VHHCAASGNEVQWQRSSIRLSERLTNMASVSDNQSPLMEIIMLRVVPVDSLTIVFVSLKKSFSQSSKYFQVL